MRTCKANECLRLLFRAFIIRAVWWAATASANQTNLQACASRYGYLMVDHWMTVDLGHQIERTLFNCSGQQTSSESGRLRAALAQTDQKLEEARDLYRQLYKTNTTTELVRLNNLLQQIAAGETQNQAGATELLQRLGEQNSPHGKFRAIVLGKDAIEPDWNLQKLIRKDYRPTRILFGSTAGPGDDRALPLRFDFGKGIFGFFAPMEAPGKLLVPDGGSHAWMREHRSGYHYWAGVYNNQNTYLAPWFLQRHGSNEDVWMRLADGKLLKSNGGDWGQVNIWNPQVRDYLRDYCETQAGTLKDDPWLLCYDYTAEPHPWAAQPPNPPRLPQYSGYNESAVRGFRDFLQKKFGSIGRLNRSWQTHYVSFSSIQPPPDPYAQPPAKATPLSYEFERFRCDSHTAFWRLAAESYRKFDKTKPIVANASMYMSGWPVEALDAWQLQKASAADWVDMHMNNFWPNLPEQIYLYSLCRLSGKVPVQFEYIWTFPRVAPFDDTSEADFRATCEASIWRNLVWGKQAFVFFDLGYDWPAYHNAFLDRDLGYSILRPSSCVIPLMKLKALRFNDLFMNTEVESPPIIVLQPSTSILNSPPIHPNQGFSYHTSIAGNEVHKLLFPKNYPFLYVPEEAVLDDGYALQKHQIIILPQAPYLPAQMTPRLLDWVKRGGTLISFGVPGIWNPYGRDDLSLVKKVFGNGEVIDQRPGQWQWSWTPLQPNPRAEWFTNANTIVAARAGFGRGRVLISTGVYKNPELQTLFYRTLDQAMRRPAVSAENRFELVLRTDPQAHRYLFALNPHTREPREDEIVLAGSHSSCIDLGIGSGVAVPASVKSNETKFRLRLEPGEGTVIALGP